MTNLFYTQFRNKHSNYERIWLLIVAIVNLREATSHLRFFTVQLKSGLFLKFVCNP